MLVALHANRYTLEHQNSTTRPTLYPSTHSLHLKRERRNQTHCRHPEPMDDVWSWITSLPTSGDWPPFTDSPPSLHLATTAGKSILLKAQRTAGSNTEALVTFSISIQGFHPSNPTKTLWVSDPIPLSPSPSPSPHLRLLLQLLNEVIALAPSATSPLPNLNPELLPSSPQSPSFLSLALLCRVFWLCAASAPADAGFLFFHALTPAIERALDCRDALRDFLTFAGADREELFMRSLGYMLAKWCILRELQGGAAPPPVCCPSYAGELYGLWVLKGYAPVPAMARIAAASSPATTGTKESVLRYALAHQQVETVVQLEYSVSFRDPRFIRVGVRVDNVRVHIIRLGFGSRSEGDGMEGERHFPSRVRMWVGPEAGSAYAVGLSLGRSTGNPEREVESTRIVKGSFGVAKVPGVKAKARSSARVRGRSWRWEQEAEGSAGVIEGVLCDAVTGAEVAGWRPEGGSGGGGDPRGGMRKRYSGQGRAFSKSGGVVVAGDELPEGLSWRVGREMEGRVVKWRMGVRVWVSYFPNEVKTGYFETRSVEWREEVELALTPGGYLV